MYLVFLQLVFFSFVTMCVINILSTQIFDTFIKLRLENYINNQSIEWIALNPNDEWISAKYANKASTVTNCSKDIDLIVSDPVMLFSYARLSSFIQSLLGSVSTPFSITVQNIFLLLSLKICYNWGFIHELLIGMIIGMTLHSSDLFINAVYYLKHWYLNSGANITVETIVNRNEKLTYKTLITVALFIIGIITTVKANVYSRVIGEWFIDLRMFPLFLTIILGYNTIQNYINIVYTCNDNPYILILSIIYVVLTVILI